MSSYNEGYETCSAYIGDNLEFPDVRELSGRQQRLHTCFDNCKDYIFDEYKYIFTFDNRMNCTLLAPEDERYLICLYPTEECEKTIHPDEFGFGEVKISITVGALAVAFSTPVQFVFELLCIYLIKIKHNQDKASESCKMLSFQIFMVLVYLYLVS